MLSKKDQVDLAEVIRPTRVGALRMSHGREHCGHRCPAIHVYHGDLVDEEDLQVKERSYLWVPRLREVQLRFQIVVKLEKGGYGSCLNVRAY